jgi:hypothetical protein
MDRNEKANETKFKQALKLIKKLNFMFHRLLFSYQRKIKLK